MLAYNFYFAVLTQAILTAKVPAVDTNSSTSLHVYIIIYNLEFAYFPSNHVSSVGNIINKERRNRISSLHINLNY